MNMTQTRFFLLLFASLETLAVQIYNCANNKVEIFEDAPVPVTCAGMVSNLDVTWRRGDGVLIGQCGAGGACTNNLYNDYSLSRSPQSTESRLTLLPEYRPHAGVTVSCTDSVSTASCTLVIRRHPVLSECDVTTDTVNGSVSGSCRVQGGYSSDNVYSCRWTVNNQQSFGAFDSARETCSFKQPLPQDSGPYTYTIAVFPPSTAGFLQTVTIVPTTSSRTVSSSLSPELTQSDNVTASTSVTSTSTSVTDSPFDTRWIIVGVVIAVAIIAIIIAAICVVINRRRIKCLARTEEKATPTKSDEFQDNVNVVYAPSDDQRQQLQGTEDPYYSTADMTAGDTGCPAADDLRQLSDSPVMREQNAEAGCIDPPPRCQTRADMYLTPMTQSEQLAHDREGRKNAIGNADQRRREVPETRLPFQDMGTRKRGVTNTLTAGAGGRTLSH